MMKKMLIAAAILISGCATQPQIQTGPENEAWMVQAEGHFDRGYELLSRGDRRQALGEFERVIALCESQYGEDANGLYTSRSELEAIYYALQAAAQKREIRVTSTLCSDVLYLQAFASLDLGRLQVAEDSMRRAIKMAPVNSYYLSELGHIYHIKREWNNALDIFIESEEAANNFSPPEVKSRELCRAKRGIGYSLIELGRLEEAEQKYNECLEIDSDDEDALRELQYIEEVRQGHQVES